jgi:glucosamine-6-phosphate deaminase
LKERFYTLKILCAKDYSDMSRKAANLISAQVLMKPNAVLGLATGSTPIGTYDQLIDWYKKGDLDFSQVTTINLDEYCGIRRDNPQSYWYFMHQHFFDHINLPSESIHLPDGSNPDAVQACQDYNDTIHRIGGIDLQLLGLGPDGHIGFNEPGTAFELETHCVALAQSTIEANKRFFRSIDEVPRHAYTMGIKTIMQAQKVLMVVSGSAKASIVRKAFFGPVTPQVPASILQMHPDFTLVLDAKAAAGLDGLDAASCAKLC